LLVSTGDQVTARIGTSATGWTATGNLAVNAIHTAIYSGTKADAEAAGNSVAVGATVAINVVTGWSTTAELSRSMTADSLTVLAASTLMSGAQAMASAKGSSDSDDKADDKADKQVKDNPNTTGTGVTDVPSADAKAAEGNTAAEGQSGESGGSVGVAAAISVNWVTMTNIARIADDVTVSVPGAVRITATNSTDAMAVAMGTSLCTSTCDANIGAAVGLNVVTVDNTAEIGSNADITGGAVTVEAIVPEDAQNEFVVRGIAAGGGTSKVGVAGSVGIMVVDFDTLARIASDAVIDSSGDVTVAATQRIGSQTLALAGAGSNGSAAVGGAIAVNIDTIDTEALVDADVTVDAVGVIAVTADSALAPLGIFPAQQLGPPPPLGQVTDPGADPEAEYAPLRPILILPGIGGTFGANAFRNAWFTERGAHPDDLQIDPLGQYYHDLIRTLRDVGYTLDVDLFAATYDWRMNPGPIAAALLDGDLTNDVFDGHIDGLTAGSITDNVFEYGVDYLGYWLKRA
ncbi:MAG: hypothetical protein ACRDPR_06015, partial [Nocardioidaceae bacterium]